MSGKKEKIKETNVLELWVEKRPEVKRWLAKLQRKAKNAFSLYRFCRWCGKEQSELLALKKDPSSKDAERLLDEFVAADTPEFTNSVKFHIVTAVKSFFKHNYFDLARASGAMTLEKKKPYYKPRKEDLRKLWNWAQNLRDKALITFVSSTAIAKETLSKVKWKHLEENWENVELPCLNIPSGLLKGHGIGRYKGVQQTTFLTPEAKRDLINYKEWIETKLGRKLTPEDNIWLEIYSPYNPVEYKRLGTLIWQLSKATGVPFSWHDARRYVNTALEEIRIPSNWARKIRGRKVRGEEAPYSRPAIRQLREKFREAVPLLEFTAEKPTVTKEMLREEVMKAIEGEKLKAIAEKHHIPIEQVRGVFREKRKSWGELETALRKTKRKTKPNSQMIVNEDELSNHLSHGWRVAAVLSNGKVVIELNNH